jgi:hypothetical protein
VQFAAAARDPQSGADGAQLAEGLRKLAGVLAALNIGGPDLPINLRVGAEHILLNPASSEVTVLIRDDLIAAASALEVGTATDGSLRGSAESIRTDRPLIEQRETVLQFFGQAAAAIQGLTPASRGTGPRAEKERVCDSPGARDVVEQLGRRLKQVSLLAPDDIVAQQIGGAYASLVTPALLNAWTADPDSAPGRFVSSPWPDRIEVQSIEPADGGACRVEGAVVYVTSLELTTGEAASREPIVLWVQKDGGWRVSAYEATLH